MHVGSVLCHPCTYFSHPFTLLSSPPFWPGQTWRGTGRLNAPAGLSARKRDSRCLRWLVWRLHIKGRVLRDHPGAGWVHEDSHSSLQRFGEDLRGGWGWFPLDGAVTQAHSYACRASREPSPSSILSEGKPGSGEADSWKLSGSLNPHTDILKTAWIL